MARGKIGQLNVSKLKTKKAGLTSDGGNLYLKTEINSGGHVSRAWIFRYQLPGGKVRDMGLGFIERYRPCYGSQVGGRQS